MFSKCGEIFGLLLSMLKIHWTFLKNKVCHSSETLSRPELLKLWPGQTSARAPRYQESLWWKRSRIWNKSRKLKPLTWGFWISFFWKHSKEKDNNINFKFFFISTHLFLTCKLKFKFCTLISSGNFKENWYSKLGHNCIVAILWLKHVYTFYY